MSGGESHSMQTHLKWTGRFEQEGNWNEMDFNHMIVDQQGKINGNGSDAVGGYNLSGHHQNNHITINKQYHGAHTVNYVGRMEDNGWITGKWDIPGKGDGNFELHVDNPEWSGH